MRQRRQGIYRLTIEQDVQLHQFGRTETVGMIVERSISFGDTLQLIIEIDNDFTQWHIIVYFHTVARNILLLHQFAALAKTKSHNRSDVVGGRDDRSTDVRLLDMIYHRNVRHATGIVYLHDMSLFVVNIIGYIGYSRNNVHIEFTIQTFLNNLHVKQTKEATTETEAQGQRRFGLKSQRRVIQLELLQRRTQVLEIFSLDRIDTSKHHRLHFLKACNSLVARTGNVCNGITHFHLT